MEIKKHEFVKLVKLTSKKDYLGNDDRFYNEKKHHNALKRLFDYVHELLAQYDVTLDELCVELKKIRYRHDGRGAIRPFYFDTTKRLGRDHIWPFRYGI